MAQLSDWYISSNMEYMQYLRTSQVGDTKENNKNYLALLEEKKIPFGHASLLY